MDLRVPATADQIEVPRTRRGSAVVVEQAARSRKRAIGEVIGSSVQFSHRERPEREQVDPARQALRQRRGRQEVRRPRQDQLARRSIAVQQLLDRQHQPVTATLDLIDDCRCTQAAQEVARILERCP